VDENPLTRGIIADPIGSAATAGTITRRSVLEAEDVVADDRDLLRVERSTHRHLADELQHVAAAQSIGEKVTSDTPQRLVPDQRVTALAVGGEYRPPVAGRLLRAAASGKADDDRDCPDGERCRSPVGHAASLRGAKPRATASIGC
jgi:hypothetical protein